MARRRIGPTSSTRQSVFILIAKLMTSSTSDPGIDDSGTDSANDSSYSEDSNDPGNDNSDPTDPYSKSDGQTNE
jgi:hypothetical protein